MRGEQLNELLIFQATPHKFLLGHFTVVIHIHSFENTFCPCLWALKLIHCYVVRTHHVINGLDNLGHFGQVNEAIAVYVVHAEMRKESKSYSQSQYILQHTALCLAVSTLFLTKIQQTKMLVTCLRFGDLFLFGLFWQYSSVQTKYNKGRFKVMATYLQQLYNFEPTFIHWLCFEEIAKFL